MSQYPNEPPPPYTQYPQQPAWNPQPQAAYPPQQPGFYPGGQVAPGPQPQGADQQQPPVPPGAQDRPKNEDSAIQGCMETCCCCLAGYCACKMLSDLLCCICGLLGDD